MKFLVPNYSCLQNPCLGDYRPEIPVLSVLCPQLNLLTPPNKNSWIRHWLGLQLESLVHSVNGLKVTVRNGPTGFSTNGPQVFCITSQLNAHLMGLMSLQVTSSCCAWLLKIIWNSKLKLQHVISFYNVSSFVHYQVHNISVTNKMHYSFYVVF
jgi:hypothetical protein